MLDHFAKEKSDFLVKKDKSRKGHIDKDVITILNKINSKKDYYTTSSCSGRIVLLEKSSKRKNEAKWIFTKHDKVAFNEINNTLKKYLQKSNNKIKIESIGEASFNGRKKRAEHKIMLRSNRLNKLENQNFQIWLKQEPIILHVRCRNINSAKKLLGVSRKIFKRAGIISLSEKKIVVEVIGSERIDAIIADRNFVADEKYLKNLVKYANRNFEENKRKSERFLKILGKI